MATTGFRRMLRCRFAILFLAWALPELAQAATLVGGDGSATRSGEQ